MREKKSDKTSLTAAEISKFKMLLLAKRNEILGDVRSMEDETLRRQSSDLSNMPTHMADAGSDNYEIEHTLGLMDSERKLVKEIDEALDRTESGTYGICEGSGKSIPKARLEAIPWAKYCVEYASMLEKNLVKKASRTPDREYDYGDDEQDNDSKYAFRRIAI
ncbi:MAG: TraR/DksA C4-type zinc finger protein [Deltaproteobacteria bacterium]|nr:TraR/DksA C4-type zinc finger protein [Deltaproteobacteria bacterium]